MFTLNCKGRLLTVDKPLVMAIINCTPDSFFEESRSGNSDQLLEKAGQMIADGAAILDIGGQSTRPGSSRVSESEELERVIQSITAIHQHFPNIIISIDTYYSLVAKEAVRAGASIVNDISAGSIDKNMFATVAQLGVPYILMHKQGDLANMQQRPQYKNVTLEVLDFFINEIAKIKKAGIKDIIIDPGFGFGKTMQHNFQLLREMDRLKILQLPIMLGISRKSMVYKPLNVTAKDALNGTTVLHTIGLMNGASILRAHDVKEACEAINLFNLLETRN